MPIVHENALKHPVRLFLAEREYITGYEVHLGGRTVDVVGWRQSDSHLVSLELKIRDWRRALRQALFASLWSDETFVVLPEESITAALANRALFEENGVGLLAVEKKNCWKVIRARDVKGIGSVSYREAAIATVKGGGVNRG